MSDWFKKLFINEVKPALERHSGGGEIPDGYILPEGTIEITENGVHDISNYAKAEVNISGSSGGGEAKDMLQARIDTTNTADYLFYYYGGDNLDFISKLDTSKVYSMRHAFSNCRYTTSVPILDTSNVEDMTSMFNNCKKIVSITFLNTSKCEYMTSMFSNCDVLTTVTNLDLINAIDTLTMFNTCKKLTNLDVRNIRTDLQIASSTTYGHLLTLESLLNTCQECINTGSSLTLTVGSANLEKLASVYVKLTGEAEEDESLPKLPMVQCESTDEGAMTIQEYMAEKGWTLA